MAKRRADTQLTREDLDREDSPERSDQPETTGPQLASQDTLAKRTILKARRSLPADQASKSTISSSPFASLLTNPLVAPSATAASSQFKISFPSAAPSSTTTATMPLPNGKAQTLDQKTKDSIASLNASFLNHFKQHFEKDPLVDLSKNCKEYIEFMKDLTSNVQTNQPTVTSLQAEPSVKLPPTSISLNTLSTPAFGGYNFNKLPNTTASSVTSATTSISFSITPTTLASSSLTSSTTATSNALASSITSDKLTTPAKTSLTTGPFSSTPATSAPTFSFLTKPATTVASTAATTTTTTTTSTSAFFSSVPTFAFGSKLDSNFKFGSATSATSTTFGSIGSSSPFTTGSSNIGSTPFGSTGSTLTSTTTPSFGAPAPTFGSFANPPQTPAKTTEEGEESGDDEKTDEPPKLTDAKMDEEGALYSKVIKLFLLREKKFESMGKGMVHIKKLPNGKNQLLVRGENALGSIWLNVVLDKTITMKKQGKKDLQVVCFTKLPEESDNTIKCVTYLLRTASESDVDDLELHLKKFQE